MKNMAEKVENLTRLFSHKFPNPKTELEFETPFQLLISTLLAAQCTDKRVNIVTQDLYRVAPDPYAMLTLGEAEVMEMIRSVNYYKTKAKHIIETSQILIERFNGEVPKTLEELQELPGVGRKTASVVQICAHEIPAFPVDTHVFRVSNLLGIANAKDVRKTEEQLKKRIPQKEWYRFHHFLILHGRYTCKARNPDCQHCGVSAYCDDYQKRKK